MAAALAFQGILCTDHGDPWMHARIQADLHGTCIPTPCILGLTMGNGEIIKLYKGKTTGQD